MSDGEFPGSGLEHSELELGARLKFIREHNGLSQRELAKRAGVPHSSISMIEQGQNSPSINSLAKILGGIPMSLAYFFSCDLRLLAQPIYRAADLQALQQTNRRGIFTEAVPVQSQESATRFVRSTYLSGADTGEILLRLPQAISGFVIEGSIELTVNAEVAILQTGDAFSLAKLQAHRLRNNSAMRNCVLLVCTAD